MPVFQTRCRLALTVAAIATSIPSFPLLSAPLPEQALSLESAYGRPRVLGPEEVPVAVAPDGSAVAYVIRDVPPEVDVKVGRWSKTGAPNAMSGAQIYVSDSATGRTKQACNTGGYSWRPSWSPDSKTLAFYSDAGGTIKLWTYDATSRVCRQVGDTVIKSMLWIGDEPQWSPDGRHVYVPLPPEGKSPGFEAVEEAAANAEVHEGDLAHYISGRGTGAEKTTDPAGEFLTRHFIRDNNAALGKVEMSSGVVQVLAKATTEPRPNVMRVSPSGKWLTYLSVVRKGATATESATQVSLAAVPTLGGPAKVVAEALPTSRRDNYRLIYTWHPTEDRLLYFQDKKVYLVDFGAVGPQRAKRLGPELGTLAPDVHFFTRDGRAAVVQMAAEKEGADTALAVVPLDGGSVKRIAIDSSRWQYMDVIRANARTVWQPDGKSLSLRLRDVKSGEVAVVRFDIATGTQRQLWKGRAELRGLNAAQDATDLFGLYEDISEVANVYRFSPDFVRGTRLSDASPSMPAMGQVRVETFTTRIPMHDHTIQEVRTAVVLPANFQPGRPVPAIVTFYPGEDAARSLETYGAGNLAGVPAAVFLSRGYALVYPHVKLGPGDSPGNIVDEIMDALMPQVYAAIEKGYVDPRRLGLQGNSFGGFATVAITTRTNLFRAAVPTNGVYDLVGFTYTGANGINVSWTESAQPRIAAHYWEAPMRYLENSPLLSIHKIQTPLLIIQGGSDRLRPEAEKLFAGLKRLDKTAELAIYERSGHWLGIWPRPQAIAATQRILDFYEAHLGSP